MNQQHPFLETYQYSLNVDFTYEHDNDGEMWREVELIRREEERKVKRTKMEEEEVKRKEEMALEDE